MVYYSSKYQWYWVLYHLRDGTVICVESCEIISGDLLRISIKDKILEVGIQYLLFQDDDRFAKFLDEDTWIKYL